jgi:lysophospholipase L1-like esterase
MQFKDQKQFFSAFLILATGGLLFYVTKPYLPAKLFAESGKGTDIVVDSLMLNAMNTIEQDTITAKDSLLIIPPSTTATDSLEDDGIVKDTTKATRPATSQYVRLIQVSDFDFNLQRAADSTGNIPVPASIYSDTYKGADYMERFFEKLYQLEQDKEGKVRIAYYGDSMIDGDLIVQDFRSALQSRFGGNGVGFVPIVSESARSRYSVKHYYKGNWHQKNYMKGRADSIPYGVSGAVFFPSDSTASVKYLASGIKNAYRLNSPRLFYGLGNPDAVLQMTQEKDTTATLFKLNGSKNLNKVNLTGNNLKKIDLDFSGAVGTPIYGVDFSDAGGIAVDGFSNRGNSGLPLSLLHTSQMREFDREMGYDLIILQFGANVLSTKTQNFNWYSSKMTRVVNHIKNLFPEADILILGTADKGTKMDDIVKTDTTVVKLLREQQRYAAQTQSGFLSLFHVMGGIHSMPIWTDEKLANNDYTHFSPSGSRKMGRLIYEEMMVGYSAFAKARTQQIKDKEKRVQQQADSLKIDSLKTETDSLQNSNSND